MLAIVGDASYAFARSALDRLTCRLRVAEVLTMESCHVARRWAFERRYNLSVSRCSERALLAGATHVIGIGKTGEVAGRIAAELGLPCKHVEVPQAHECPHW